MFDQISKYKVLDKDLIPTEIRSVAREKQLC